MKTANEFFAVKKAYDALTDNGFDRLLSTQLIRFNKLVSKTGYQVKLDEGIKKFIVTSDWKKSSLELGEMVKPNEDPDLVAYQMLKTLKSRAIAKAL
jgi:hypothetical protein